VLSTHISYIVTAITAKLTIAETLNIQGEISGGSNSTITLGNSCKNTSAAPYDAMRAGYTYINQGDSLWIEQ
jgi:hypothetical protein